MSKHPTAPVKDPRRRVGSRSTSWQWIAAGAGVVALLAASFVVPRLFERGAPGATADRPASGPAPSFAERDAVTGDPVSSATLRGRNVLLFFSEGVMCQACFEQIQSLQQRADELERRGLVLVNITTDPPSALRQAAAAYGITTPLISDEDRDMSRAYDVLGQGMHPDTAGHTFVLLDRTGRIRWRNDYQTMFVQPETLLADIPRA
ncbi:AhpC/TSA family [Gaiella occulta]|uniref:AhpC/TSA family n=1 Tax=Gaiella occulta TaxID=1002870 RepID=A0A7M2YVB3_9ACTN|nr:redoxin domain-containing protein [Gaiella occulta]RDI73660.1 AhpC/TSA family [Gaiella occulta]